MQFKDMLFHNFFSVLHFFYILLIKLNYLNTSVLAFNLAFKKANFSLQKVVSLTPAKINSSFNWFAKEDYLWIAWLDVRNLSLSTEETFWREKSP